jgi:threonyl-tRNA synthetase
MEADQLYRIRHSLSHVLAMAVLERFPQAKLAIGPAIDTGFYYDFDLGEAISADDLLDLQKRMEHILTAPLSFVQSNITLADARVQFAGQPYKLELIEELAEKGEGLTCYTSGSFTDLCAGPHVVTTAEIKPGCFLLDRLAGAYWRGDEKRPMLQRIYGLAFEDKAALDAYLAMREEAKARDHRKLGSELDLFVFSDLVGSGLPLWTPKGQMLRTLLDDRVWALRQPKGYMKVEIPHITKKDLYETSGHWEKFQHELFHITTREGHEFVMKPMNCPHHTQIFARKKWSYRELPQRYANSTMCYRDEQTGELSGLSRVRAFCQDDSHVFCRYDQVKDEMEKIWDIVNEFYAAFGFTLRVRLSYHDPENMSAYLGDESLWQKMEADIKQIAIDRGADFFMGVGEAAFYGPKLDFMGYDSLGRQLQLATIQLDMNMPQRFGLTYTGTDGTEQPVMMIHAAIMGSIDRFLSVMIEHTAGNFPLWLAPTQVSIASVNDAMIPVAERLAEQLRTDGFRVEVDSSSESVGKKLRAAALQKIPLKLVVGQKEADSADAGWQLVPNWRADVALTEEGQVVSYAELTTLLRDK